MRVKINILASVGRRYFLAVSDFALTNNMKTIDQDKCIGCGLCAGTSPENFMMNADGKAEPINDEVNDASKEAAANCPVGAITVK